MNRKKVNNLDVAYENDRFLTEVLEKECYGFLSCYPTVVDVGANIGTFAFFIYNQAKEIYCIEPVRENLNCLNATVLENNLTKIKIIPKALSNYEAKGMMLTNGEAGDGGWSLSTNGSYIVDVTTLNKLVEEAKIDYIDLLKLDCEGSELQILDDFPTDKVGTIIGELHDTGLEVKYKLANLGYRVIELPENYFLARKR